MHCARGLAVLACLAATAAAEPLAAAADARSQQPSRAHRVDGSTRDWRGIPTNLAGRTQVSRGELVHTDWLYDDYGADLDGLTNRPAFRATLAPTNGDLRYPDDPDRYGYNAADLRELRIAADRRWLHLLVALQTMKVRDAAIVTVAIDGDGRADTGPVEWPHRSGIRTPGADRFVTLWGTGARLVDAAGRTTGVRVATGLEQNVMEARVSLKRLGPLSAGARVWVVTGLAAPGGRFRTVREGAAAVFNAGFRPDEPFPRFGSYWGEHQQSRQLARRDVTPFAHPLDLRALQQRRNRPYRPVPGFYNRIFRSAQRLGEGIHLKQDEEGDPGVRAAGTAPAQFLSPHQPYGLWIPAGWDPSRPAPLLLDGHSLDLNHNQYMAVAPNRLRQLGDERGSLVITPLARGSDTWYLTAGLVDVLEAWKDVRRFTAVDEDRTSITGYSMGGYMTYRLGLLRPDAFARASVYVGPPAYYFWPHPLPLQSTDRWRVRADTNRLVENAWNLPYEIVHGNADELVPIGGVAEQAEDLRAAGNVVRFHHHQADDHFSFILADRWERTREWLGDHRRERFPTRVRYRRYPAMDLPQAHRRWNRAYWVSGIEVRGEGEAANGFVDATTFGRGGHRRRLETSREPFVGEGASPAVMTDQRAEPGAALPAANGFEAELEGLSAVTFELAGMGLTPRRPIEAHLSGDGTTTVRLAGRFRRRPRASFAGRPVAVRRSGRRAVALRLPLGSAAGRLVVRP